MPRNPSHDSAEEFTDAEKKRNQDPKRLQENHWENRESQDSTRTGDSACRGIGQACGSRQGYFIARSGSRSGARAQGG